MEVVDLAVLDLEVPPRCAPKPAGLRAALGPGALEGLVERATLVGRQGPLAHLGVRPDGQVDAAEGTIGGEPVRGRGRREPAGVRLEGLEEAVDPALLAPAVLPGGRPGAELLAVVTHRAEPTAVVGGVVPQVGDDVVHAAEGDPVAEPLLGSEDGEELALVVRRVRTPHRVLGDRRGAEVGVVDDRALVAGTDERRGEIRLPDALGQPGGRRPAAEEPLDLVGHAGQLAEPVALGEGGEDRLEVAAAEDLHLAARDQGAEAGDEVGMLGDQPLEERTRVVEREAHARVPVEGFDHRQVGMTMGVLDDPAEVADRLVVVEGQGRGRCDADTERTPGG